MKLLRELNESVAVEMLEEEVGGVKSLFIEGIFMQGNIPNRNKRRYPTHILEREVDRYNREYIQENRGLGELGHPDTPSINLERVSHKIVSLRKDGDNFIGKAKILGTPYGQIARNLLENEIKIGVSSLALGSLKPMSEGYSMVQDDLRLSTPADIVADPSAPDAFVQSIMEDKEWIYQGGLWVEQFVDKAKNIVNNTSKIERQEKFIGLFEAYLKRL
jgi:hypothetical protein